MEIDLSEFKTIGGFPNYKINKEGVIISNWSSGPGRSIREFWRVLKTVPNKRGRMRISLTNHIVKRKQMFVHRLVLETFIGPCPPGMECCHEDGNPSNNKLENLRWDTKLENANDNRKNGITSTRKILSREIIWIAIPVYYHLRKFLNWFARS